MDIICFELKKIFNIKSIVLLVLINIIMYFLFIEFEVTHFPNGRPALNIYNMFVEMKSEYGEFMDEEEFEDFKIKYQEAIRKADEYIQSREDFKSAGITNYEEFDNMDLTDKELDRLYNDVILDKKIDVFWEIPLREEYIQVYENKEQIMMAHATNEKQEARINEILKKSLETSVFNDVVFSNYNNLIKSVATTILLSVMFIITPTYLRDNRNRINNLQYTSKTGRYIFKKKIISGLLASFILVTLQIVLFLGLYSTNNTSMFFNCSINSIYNSIISWYDFTFMQYIILTVVGIQLPIALFTFKILLKYLLYYITDIRYPKYLLGFTYMGLIFISIILIISRWKREKKVDVLY